MSEPGSPISRKDVAKGAGLAGVARLGGLVEALAQPLFVWLYGLATYGLYVAVWGAINFVSNLIDLAMTHALQRVVPTADEEAAHAAVKGALLLTVLPACLLALVASWQAETLAAFFSATAEDRATLPQAIRLFAWALPLWTFVEIATSAVRARRGFGPEIRLRIFWEQVARILFALGFFAAGSHSLGLMLAHLCSLALTASLCLPLLGRYYDLGRLARARLEPRFVGALIGSGLSLMPSNVSRRLLIDAPPLLLNLALPGTSGAIASGLFEIARKISTVPLVVRQAFQYVMAPLSSAQARDDRTAIGPLYRFACRVSAALVLPLAGLLIFAGADILSIYRPEAAAALPLLYLLVTARAFEAVLGPATTLVEMTGHRLLPVVNSLVGTGLWALLAWLLVPAPGPWGGAMGMAIAVAAATVAISYAAAIELGISDGLWPFDRRLARAIAIAGAGIALMALAESLAGGPMRFALVLLLWAGTSWLALRFGLVRSDRAAFGRLGRRLRLAD